MKLLRGDRQLEVQIASVEQPHDIDRLIDLANPTTDSIPALGIIGIGTNRRVEELLGPLRLPLGVAVAAVIPTTSGVTTGLQPSDVIHAVNGDLVNSFAEFRSRLELLKPGDPIALLIERGGRVMYLAFNL